MLTEQRMKHELDGLFMRFAPDGSVRVQKVPTNFLPRYKHESNGLGRKFGRPWSNEETEKLIAMYKNKVRRDDICRELRRATFTVGAVLKQLRADNRL